MFQPDAAALLTKVNDDARSVLGNGFHGCPQLPAAIAAPRAEYIPGETLRVHPHQHGLIRANIAQRQSDMRIIIILVLIKMQSKFPEIGGKRNGGGALDQRLLSAAITN